MSLCASCGTGASAAIRRVAVPRSTGELTYDREHTLHVGPGGAEVRDAGSQREAPIDGRVGEVDAAVALERVQYPLVVRVECGLVHVWRRMSEAADAQSWAGEQLEVVRNRD